MPSKIGVAEQIAAGLLVIIAIVIAVAYFSAAMNWVLRQLR
jgi:hypothetical protein